jgi:signal transduction histidine kinase
MLKRSQLLQKQLKRLPQLILSAQEEERKRISRELHDVIAQTLTGINLSLSELRTQGGYKSATLDRAQTMISRAIDSVHGFARELRPAVLDDIGLIPALRTFLSDFATLTGIHTKLTGPAIADPSEPAVRTVLFRVAQEALQNVARHAEASHVAVDIHSSAEGVVMTIRNDGRPFDVTRALNFTLGRRLGLIGMRERLEMVGGDLSVESTPNRGTVVTARIPHSKTVRRKRLPRP